MHLASRLVQNDHAPRRGRPFHPLDKRYRGGGVPRVGVHFLNDRPRSVEELDAELHCRTLAVTTPTAARTFATPHISSRYRASTAAKVKGFGRRPPARGGARHGEAGVRKPPKEETAFRKGRWRRSCDLWGFEDRSLLAARS